LLAGLSAKQELQRRTAILLERTQEEASHLKETSQILKNEGEGYLNLKNSREEEVARLQKLIESQAIQAKLALQDAHSQLTAQLQHERHSREVQEHSLNLQLASAKMRMEEQQEREAHIEVFKYLSDSSE
jgi:hypothetical protein